MSKSKSIEDLQKLSDKYEKIELAYELVESEETDILSLLLEIILNSESYSTTLDYEMFIEIVKKSEKEREAIVSKIIKEIERSPLSERGNAFEYALGEIVRFQLTTFKQIPNPDIPKILLKAGEDSIAQATTKKLNSLIYCLLQYANFSPLPEAETFLRKALEICTRENDEDLDTFTLGYTLDLLYLNNGEVFLAEMKDLFKNLKEGTELASYIEMFVIEKEEELLEM
jgi:hypothetical protein